MFNYFKKSFLIIFFLGISSSIYAIDTTTFASILSPFSYVYNKLNQYDYTIQNSFERAEKNGYFSQESLQAIKQYLAKGHNPNIKIGENKKTPFIIATELQHLDMIKLLLHYKADINIPDFYGDTPLFIAIKKNNLQLAKYLLEHGATSNPNSQVMSPLIYAVHYQYFDMIKLLLQYDADVNYSNCWVETPLSIALEKGDFEIAEYLLKHGAKLNKIHIRNLVSIIAYKDLEMIKFLIQHGVNINNYDNQGNTLLSTAIEIGNIETIKILCNAGVSLSNIKKSNSTSDIAIFFHTNSSAFHIAVSGFGHPSREKIKKCIETLITYVHFDDLPRIALEILLILKKQYPETYKDLHDLTLSKLLASNNINNLDDFKKKMGQELFIMTTYKDPILAQVYKRILRLKEILQMQNDQNQTALELWQINYSHNPKYIQEVAQLLDGTKLNDDFNKLEAALKNINSESKKKLTATELISELESKLDLNNLALQMYKNCVSLENDKN